MRNPPTPYDGRMNVVQDATGQYFYSQQDCAFANERHKRVVSYHLHVHGDLSRLGQGNARPGIRNRVKPVRIGQWSWDCQADAAKDLGVDPMTIYRWISPKATPAQRDNMMLALMRWRNREAKQ